MKNNSFIKNFLIYGLGNILFTLVTLLLVPVYLQKLSIADYGVLSIFLVSVNIIAILFSFSILNGILRALNDNYTTEEKNLIFSTSIYFFLLFSIILFFISKDFEIFLSKLFFNSAKYGKYVSLIILTAATRIFINIFQGFFLGKEYASKYVLLNITNVTFLGLINIYIIYFTQYSLYTLMLGYLGSGVITITLGLILTLKNIRFSFKVSKLKYLIRYGLPLSLASLVVYSINYGNRYFIVHIQNESAVAIIDVSQKIASIVGALLTNAFITTFTPYYLKLYNNVSFDKFNNKINELILLFSFIFLLFSLIIVMFNDLGLMLLSKKEYMYSSLFVPYILLANFLYVLFMILTLGTNIRKETQIEMYITFAMFLSSVVFNIVGIKLFGLYGAVFSQILMYVIGILLINRYNKRFFKIEITFNKLFKLLATFILLVVFKQLVDYFIRDEFFFFTKLLFPFILILIFILINRLYLYEIIKRRFLFKKIVR